MSVFLLQHTIRATWDMHTYTPWHYCLSIGNSATCCYCSSEHLCIHLCIHLWHVATKERKCPYARGWCPAERWACLGYTGSHFTGWLQYYFTTGFTIAQKHALTCLSESFSLSLSFSLFALTALGCFSLLRSLKAARTLILLLSLSFFLPVFYSPVKKRWRTYYINTTYHSSKFWPNNFFPSHSLYLCCLCTRLTCTMQAGQRVCKYTCDQ